MSAVGIARDAATAVGFGDRPPPKRMRLISFRPVVKGSLRGFCNVELPSGLVLKDVSVFVARGKAWAALPARPVIDSDGRHHVINDKRQYAAAVQWRNRDLNDRWSAAVVELIRAKHPDALDEAAP
jgi:hypothetical protein